VRFDLIAVGLAYDRAEIRFNPRLTVIGGMGLAARAEFAGLLVGAMSGSSDEVAEARWVDDDGIGIRAVREAGAWPWVDDDGAACSSPLSLLCIDPAGLARLMVQSSAELGAGTPGPQEGEPLELVEARATLAAIDAELNEAIAVRTEVDALRVEVATIDERLRRAEAGASRRRYARLSAELEQVRVEAATIQGGSTVAQEDRRFLESTEDLDSLAIWWRHARDRVRAERQRFGARERLDARTLAVAIGTPDQVPPELEALAAAYEAAEANLVALDQRLTALATQTLPQPSHPAVIRLAHSDQDLVWSMARQARDATERLEHQSLALGGLEAEGVAPSAAAELETAHDEVDRAERELHRRRVPGLGVALAAFLLALAGVLTTGLLILAGIAIAAAAGVWSLVLPARELARRQAQEADALQRAGVGSYMAFQMRRLEVNIDPKATEPLELAALEYRRILTAWRKLAGDLRPDEALALEAETREYVESLTGSRGAADEIAQVRHQLATDAEPAVTRARTKLITACEPFGIDDARLAVDLVRHQARTSSVARLQANLETAERDEREAREALEHRLTDLGFAGAPPTAVGAAAVDGEDLDRRLGAFAKVRAAAEAREKARAAARPVDEIEADLARLEGLVEARSDLDWDIAAEEEVLDEARAQALRDRRDAILAAHESSQGAVPDIERLTDRREAVERRVAVLTSEGGASGAVDPADVQQRLLARLAAARRVGPSGRTVPVVLDEPFERIRGDRKWRILDAVDRLAASVQIIYLTDDVDVLVWARARRPAGTVTLLEPSPEPA